MQLLPEAGKTSRLVGTHRQVVVGKTPQVQLILRLLVAISTLRPALVVLSMAVSKMSLHLPIHLSVEG
jgi:hypothetical protein